MLKSFLNKMWNSETMQARRYRVAESKIKQAIADNDEESLRSFGKSLYRISQEAWVNGDNEKEKWTEHWKKEVEKALGYRVNSLIV